MNNLDNEIFKDFAIKKKLENSKIAREILLWLCKQVDLKDFVFTNKELLNNLFRRFSRENVSRILCDFEFWGLIEKHNKLKKCWVISSGSDFFLVKKYEGFVKNV